MNATVTDGRLERLEPYLRPNQVDDLLEERKGIEKTLNAPAYAQSAIADRGAMMRHHRHITHQLTHDSPKPYVEDERDVAVKRVADLEEKIQVGMPTHAEMRRNPHGAVDKHRLWEERNLNRILEWKNVRLRMHASGMIDGPSDARDIANIETMRPTYSPQELAMRGEQIPGKVMSMPRGKIASRNHMSDEDRAALKAKYGDDEIE